jgi:hypothetical protein
MPRGAKYDGYKDMTETKKNERSGRSQSRVSVRDRKRSRRREAAQRRSVREAAADQERAKQSKWKPEYAENRRRKKLTAIQNAQSSIAITAGDRRIFPKKQMVDSPTVPGAREEVNVVKDNIEAMRKRLTDRQYRAAKKYRTACYVIYGAVGGVMDFDRARGGGTPGAGLIPLYSDAAETLRQARNKLYPAHYRLVQLICGADDHGGGEKTIEEAASIMRNVNASMFRTDLWSVAHTKKAFYDALDMLADLWFRDRAIEGGDIVAERNFVRAEQTAEATSVPKAVAVHATSRKIFRAGEKAR